MPPIHAYEMNRPIHAEFREVRQGTPQEICEFLRGHLAGRHRELAVLGRPQPRNVPRNPHIVGRISEYHLGLFALQEPLIASGLEGISAQEKMVTYPPAVTGLGYGRGGAIDLG